ncbi:CDP-diacylglycerol--serine O-phosphatidyltransferase [Polyangium mundeleinium]|uniref:CDP-diacylglycerol--serine O-phosphatidyltransferase n=1 Tax=Polyangium mundeleinium TaxID=2995306 RepID=A0ABT5ENX0_9BACT|nr:CDP-diacylglycerol--serine O-phosphatidyltransferase [Polyangium mundeleinium]MDC0742450.1 CDP-diacylglycerol--serine O-phosphatidyltransferase [Polyangium mundeleinium]
MGKGIRLRKFELKKTLFLLPNLITLTSIFCGFDSIRTSATAQGEADFYRAALLIVFAMFFDTLDGRVARATKTQSAFGLQIDSLADVVSFGVAPSLLLYQWTLNRLGTLGLVASFLFTACGAIRLARFNVLSTGDDGKPSKPSKYIVGLPIPGAAGILVSLVVASHAAGGMLGRAEYTVLMLGVTIGLSMLMVSTIRFRSFKDVKLNAGTALLAAFMVGSSVAVSLKMQPAFVLVWLLGCYVTMGILESLWHLPRRLRASLLAGDSNQPPPAASA